MKNVNCTFRLILTIAVLVLSFAATTGCVSQPDKRGNAIVLRDARAIKENTGNGGEIDRIIEIAIAKTEAHGKPDKAILPVTAPQIEKDKESKETATAIKETASFLGGLFGGKLMVILASLGSLGGIAMLAYTGRWGLAMKQLVGLFSQGVEEGKSNGAMKKYLSSKTKGTWAGKLLDKYVVKAEKVVGAGEPGVVNVVNVAHRGDIGGFSDPKPEI